jgi:hypothetical protein
MTEVVLLKTAAGALVPADPQAAAYVAKLKMGCGVRAMIKKVNNPQFHRKMFALFNLAFEAWEPGEKEYKGQTVRKEFDQFRKDLTILAGFYDTAITLRNEVRLTAKSLRFDRMDHDERERVYDALVNVILQRVLTTYTRDDLDNVVNQLLLGFA